MKEQEVKWITGLKGFCCITVVLLHLLACLFVPAQNATYKYLPITGMYNFIQLTPINIFFNGSFSVYIFWTISAFLLTWSYNQNPSANMLARKNVSKFFRIMIPVVIVSIIAFTLLQCGLYYHLRAGGLLKHSFWITERDYTNFDIKSLIRELLWLNWMGESKMIPPLWTIKNEFIGCILVSMLLTTGLGKNKKIFAFLSILFFVGNFRMYICFIAGMLLANVYEDSKRGKGSKKGIIYFVLGVVIGAYPPTGVPAAGMYRWVYDGILTKINAVANRTIGVHLLYILGAFLIMYGIIKCDGLKKMFSCKVLHYLGTLSMYIYICHIPVIWSVAAYVFYRMYAKGNNIFVSAAVCASVGIWVTIACSVMLKKADDAVIGQKVRSIVNKILE